jgi:hypothetical protein
MYNYIMRKEKEYDKKIESWKLTMPALYPNFGTGWATPLEIETYHGAMDNWMKRQPRREFLVKFVLRLYASIA